MESLQGQCHFEEIKEEDFLDALTTLNLFGVTYRCILPTPSQEARDYIQWSLKDIELARNAETNDDKFRHTSNALINSRRSLSCLVDFYLKRDGFYYCKDKPINSYGMAKILVQRGIIDDLTERVLARAIKKRNQAEHEYVKHPLQEVEDVVELMRRTIESLINISNPDRGAFILGSLQYSLTGDKIEFRGWANPLFLLNTISVRPWMAIIIPSSLSEATVRRVFLKDISCDNLLKILKKLDETQDSISGGFSDNILKKLLCQTGLEL